MTNVIKFPEKKYKITSDNIPPILKVDLNKKMLAEFGKAIENVIKNNLDFINEHNGNIADLAFELGIVTATAIICSSISTNKEEIIKEKELVADILSDSRNYFIAGYDAGVAGILTTE